MSAANQKSKEDEARNAKQLMAVAGRAEKLEAELAQTRAEAAEKCCQLAKYREEVRVLIGNVAAGILIFQ